MARDGRRKPDGAGEGRGKGRRRTVDCRPRTEDSPSTASASTGRRTVNELCGARRTAGRAESYRLGRPNRARCPGEVSELAGHDVAKRSTARPGYTNTDLINTAYAARSSQSHPVSGHLIPRIIRTIYDDTLKSSRRLTLR